MSSARPNSLLKCDKCFLSSSLNCVVERHMKTEESPFYIKQQPLTTNICCPRTRNCRPYLQNCWFNNPFSWKGLHSFCQLSYTIFIQMRLCNPTCLIPILPSLILYDFSKEGVFSLLHMRKKASLSDAAYCPHNNEDITVWLWKRVYSGFVNPLESGLE